MQNWTGVGVLRSTLPLSPLLFLPAAVPGLLAEACRDEEEQDDDGGVGGGPDDAADDEAALLWEEWWPAAVPEAAPPCPEELDLSKSSPLTSSSPELPLEAARSTMCWGWPRSCKEK